MTDREFIIKWIEALRSGKYVQGRKALACKDGEEWKYCCLGVACELWQEIYGNLKEEIKQSSIGHFLGEPNGAPVDVKYYNDVAQYPIGIDFLREDFEASGLKESYQVRLAILNDNDGKSFAEIADYIEKEILPKFK